MVMAVAEDELTLQKMYLISQLLPVVFRHASSSTGGMCSSEPHEVPRSGVLQSSEFGSNIN